MERLFHLAVGGDQQARNQLLVKFLPRLCEQVQHWLNVICRAAQSDVLQSVLRRILEKFDKGLAARPTYDEFCKYISVVVRNRCHDEWRRFLKQAGALPEADGIPARPDTKQRDDLAVLVWLALQQLPKRYRDVLECTWYDRLSRKQIGDSMDPPLSEGAVGLLRHRALKALKKLLTLHEDRHGDE
jgi:RNA polymerase sigma factor (sigma-70 family)